MTPAHFDQIILTIATCFLYRSAPLIVDLFREASRALTSTPCLLFQPVITTLASLVVCFYWLLIICMLATSDMAINRADADHVHIDTNILGVGYNRPTLVKSFWWYHLIGCLWTIEFFNACQQMIVAGAVAYWYFAKFVIDVASIHCHIVL